MRRGEHLALFAVFKSSHQGNASPSSPAWSKELPLWLKSTQQTSSASSRSGFQMPVQPVPGVHSSPGPLFDRQVVDSDFTLDFPITACQQGAHHRRDRHHDTVTIICLDPLHDVPHNTLHDVPLGLLEGNGSVVQIFRWSSPLNPAWTVPLDRLESST